MYMIYLKRYGPSTASATTLPVCPVITCPLAAPYSTQSVYMQTYVETYTTNAQLKDIIQLEYGSAVMTYGEEIPTANGAILTATVHNGTRNAKRQHRVYNTRTYVRTCVDIALLSYTHWCAINSSPEPTVLACNKTYRCVRQRCGGDPERH
jgi:hypothetical protein